MIQFVIEVNELQFFEIQIQNNLYGWKGIQQQTKRIDFIKIMANKQTIYIRKLNGLGQKISVQSNLTVKELKQIVRNLHSLQASELKQKDFNLIFKGKNITEKVECTLKDLNIPSDGIVHLVFISEEQQKNGIFNKPVLQNLGLNHSQQNISININKPIQISLRVMFSGIQYQFFVNPLCTVLDLKKKIAIKLNLIYQSLVLSHLGVQMLNDKTLRDYSLTNDTLISLKFNLQKPQKKKLQSRMVSSVTFSDQNNQPNSNNVVNEFQNNKFANSSKSIDSDKDQQNSNPKKLTSLMGNNRTNMYKSDINSFGSSGASKAALMFKTALHQKIVQTQSVVSGSFSEDTSLAGSDPNSIMITVKNEEQTKQYVFQCAKTHQILNIREKLLQVQKICLPDKLQISLEEDLFQSIDLNKSGCVTLSQIVKKMGKQRAVFIYRII